MRYGCVSPTPEMEVMDHSDSESSDASFEIVSAEGINDCQSITPSFKPCIKFHDIFDVYPMDADVVARVSASDDYKISADDKVVVVPLAWTSVDQAVCVSKLNGFHVRFDVNELPKTPADQFYQLCYGTAEGNIVGVSTPFFFREVHEEDLMEFQKEHNKEFWTFRSRFAVLTDLYWNAIKNNHEITHSDKMTDSCGTVIDSKMINKSLNDSCSADKDTGTTSCSADRDTDTTSCSADKDTGTTSCSADRDTGTTSCSADKDTGTTSCSEDKDTGTTEVVDESSIKSFSSNKEIDATTDATDESSSGSGSVSKDTEASETGDKLSIESCSTNKNFNMTEKASSETANKKCDDPVQPQKVKEHTLFKLQISENSEKQPKYTSIQIKTSQDSLAELNKKGTIMMKWMILTFHTNRKPLTDLEDFRALPESIVGRLVLETMKDIPVERLETDPFLCAARRKHYNEFMREYGGKPNSCAIKLLKEPAEYYYKTIQSLTSKIESQAKLMQDLKYQLMNESETVEGLKLEYEALRLGNEAYKNEMEKRLKTCAKEYAKVSMKLVKLHLSKRGH